MAVVGGLPGISNAVRGGAEAVRRRCGDRRARVAVQLPHAAR